MYYLLLLYFYYNNFLHNAEAVHILGNFILPKGANIIIEILKIHRNEKYWPKPLKFDPDRFSRETKNCESDYYIPFSKGRRGCIGKYNKIK